jgi:glycosyltransferase involved in cell wall biosynthesis
MSAVSFVTVCKGRLHHLQQTLPLWIEQQPAEIVVVDYACPQGTADWVAAHHPTVRVVRVEDDPGFSLARARNIGARAATHEWLAMIDADILTRPGWTSWMRDALRPGYFYTCEAREGPDAWQAFGTVLCSRKAFDRVGGFDEAFRTWGGEDSDIYDRFVLAGELQDRYPQKFVQPIHHGDDERVVAYDIKDMWRNTLISMVYRQFKLQLMGLSQGRAEIPFDRRLALMNEVRGRIERWKPDRGPLEVSVGLDIDMPIMRGMSARRSLRLQYRLTKDDLAARRFAPNA